MDIIVIGVGDNLNKAGGKMKEMAGSKGTVHLFHSYLDMTRHFSEMHAALCGELMSGFPVAKARFP